MAGILTQISKTPWPKMKIKQIIGSMKFEEDYEIFCQL
jgi:hypothetical protein